MSFAVPDRRSVMAFIWDAIGDSYGSGSPLLVDMAELLVERAHLQPGEHVIDLGTGNGHGLIPAAKAIVDGEIVGIDISNAMLDAARTRATQSGLHNVELRNMDVADLDFPDATFDVALASTVFQFVNYAPAVLTEWRRVLVPGGRLLLSVPVPGSVLGPLEDLMGEFFTRLPQEMQEAALKLGAPTGPQTLPDLVELCKATGFAHIHVEDDERVYLFPDTDAWWTFHWTHGSRSFLMGLPPDALEDMKSEAARRLQPTLLPTGEVPLTRTVRICSATAP